MMAFPAVVDKISDAPSYETKIHRRKVKKETKKPSIYIINRHRNVRTIWIQRISPKKFKIGQVSSKV